MGNCVLASFDPLIAGLIVGAAVVWFMPWLLAKAAKVGE